MKIELTCLKYQQGEVERYTAAIPYQQLRDICVIDIFESNGEAPNEENIKNTGYQRKTTVESVRKGTNYLRKYDNPTFPTSLLINIRNEVSIEHIMGNVFKIIIDENTPIYIVDGQHRVLYLNNYIERFGWDAFDEKFNGSFELPINVSINKPKKVEMRDFITVNGNQKKVSAHMTSQILSLSLIGEPEESLSKEEKRSAVMVAVCNYMLSNNTVLSDIFIPANQNGYSKAVREENPDLVNKRLTKTSTFDKSISWVYNILNDNKVEREIIPGFSTFTKEGQIDTISSIMVAYWTAIYELLPEGFINAAKYSLVRSLGINTLNRFLANLLKAMDIGGRDIFNKDEYKVMLSLKSCFNQDNIDDYWLTNVGDYACEGSSDQTVAKIANLIYENRII